MEWILEESWREKLKGEEDKRYYKELVEKVREEYKNRTCYPPEDKIFNAFNLCPFDKVKVVIMGQDPYFNPGQAMGLSFSVPDKAPLPPSLRTLYNALGMSFDGSDKFSGDLTRWAEQGVLLLNTTLTVHKRINLTAIGSTSGGVLRMPLSGHWMLIVSISSLCCGDV